MQSFFQNIRQFFSRLSMGQLIGLGMVVLFSVALLAGIGYWANKPDYALLFGSMKAADASSVVQTLKEENVDYKLKDNGTAVYVPREKVHELRLRFVSQGVVSEGQTGYELFDEGALGMTDFMQRLNEKRALEGELSQTISSLDQVAVARVHLVLPERNPFREAQAKATASVVLQMNGVRLPQARVRAITELVAGAAEGLSPTAVTVLDTEGNLLSDPNAGDTMAQLSTTQLEVQKAIEKRLAKKGQSMLNEVLGAGRSIVRVSAKLDFSKTITERSAVDPESATIISEERIEEQGEENTGSNSRVRNYEVSRTHTRSEKGRGDISYLTVSILIDHEQVETSAAEEGNVQKVTYEPRSEQELKEIENIVKNAVGFNARRGDRLSIEQMRFDASGQERVRQSMREKKQQERLQMYVRYGLIALALLVALWLVRSVSRRVTAVAGDQLVWQGQPAQDPAALRSEARNAAAALSKEAAFSDAAALSGQELSEEEEMMLVDDMYTSKLSSEAKAELKARHQIFKDIREQAEKNPEDAAQLITSWIVEDQMERV